MKKLTVITAMLLGIVVVGTAFAGEKYYVVKLSDRTKNESYDVMTPDRFKELVASIKSEARLFPKALALSAKEWKKRKATKNKTFPKSAVAMRKAKKLSEYTDREKADDKVFAYETRVREKAEKNEEKLKAKNKQKSKVRIAKEEKKQMDRQRYVDAARAFFEQKLEEVRNPPAKE